MKHRHRIDLLPEVRVIANERGFLVRLGVVVCVGVAGCALVASLLLVPTHLALKAARIEKQTELAALETASVTSDSVTVSTRLERLVQNVTAVKALSRSYSGSTALRHLLEVPRHGVQIHSLTYAPGQPNKLTVVGIAATRDDLHDYQTALQQASFVANSQLPVSSYAKNVNVPFTITLTLAP